jgi:hypothetical protein
MRNALLALSLSLAATGIASAQSTVGAANASSVVGTSATVCGKIDSFRFNENSEGQPTFLHMGGAFPRHAFAVRINGADRGRFNPAPEQLVGSMVCVTGSVALAQGNLPEMALQSPNALTVM